MFDKYLVTGATGFLGLAVVRELVRRGETVRALVLEGDPCAELLPRGVDTVIGDVCVKDSLAAFFGGADSRTCVLHCAGIICVNDLLCNERSCGTYADKRNCAEGIF